ncbi:hypothetical protein [Streptomyces sp. SBT349]|uniref:hypothetical protein n=1 Tax=Streptomyces sp. SBT349 TaxID=1580539 RepID=UPI00069FDA98
MDADGRISVELRLPETEEARLLLRLRPKKGKEPREGEEPPTHAVPLRRVSAAADRWRTELDDQVPELAEGRWDLFVERPGAPRLRVVPGVRDLRVLASDPPPAPTLPLAVRVPYATKDGYLALRAWQRRAHAEAGDVRVRDGALTVWGRLLGATPGRGAKVQLKRRGRGGPTVVAALRDEGEGAFSFHLVYDDLPHAEDGPDPAYWDVSVKPSAKSAPVRVARLLDDVADKKPVFVYPATTVGPLTIRPYYTLDNDLAVQVSAM